MNAFRMLTPLAFVLLTACGSSSDSDSGVDYKGITTAATISDSNKSALADSSSELVVFAVQSENSSDSLDNLPYGIQVSSVDPELISQAKAFADAIDPTTLGNVPVGASGSATVDGDCGGSATISGSENDLTISYSSFCIDLFDDEMVASGKLRMQSSVSGSTERFTITYTNFSMSVGGESFSISGTLVSETNTETDLETYSSWNLTITADGVTTRSAGSVTCTSEDNCTYTEQFEGADGETYQVADLDVAGNSSTGYDISATFYDPDYGYVELTASDILLCDDGSIASGTITLTDEDDNVLTITFNGCGQDATVTLSGVAEVIAQ
ncbi:hypothetical protein ACQUQU_03320 [Thalassolituus sp. LLYu03]|uniref:hypothetical protein n=1 Tax=Thalassolituus sp. LLYu03 TaxID=3421656 RepID=UPI003D2DE7EE